MTDIQRKVNDRSEQAKPEQMGEQSQQSAAARRAERAAPGRGPLFCNTLQIHAQI